MQVFDILSKYGISFQDADKTLLHNDAEAVNFDSFVSDAESLLVKLEPIIREHVINHLEDFDGRWHPSGFMVYQLGSHKDLGTLRFHIWPRGMRKRLEKGRGEMGEIYDGDIHNHAWHIASLSMEYYEDIIYTVKDIDAGYADHDDMKDDTHYRIYNVSYNDEGKQGLFVSPRTVSATTQKRRYADRGEFHTIEYGVYHAPTIPVDKLGCTLVFDSHRVGEGPDVLVGSSNAIFDSRRAITRDEALAAKEQFANVHALA